MVYVHFARPSNNTKLIKIQLYLGLKKGSILRVCDTRWVCRFKNCEAMIRNYTAIIEYSSNEIEEQSVKDVVKAIGIVFLIFTFQYKNNKKFKYFYYPKR